MFFLESQPITLATCAISLAHGCNGGWQAHTDRQQETGMRRTVDPYHPGRPDLDV
jgi:hypothetical protein